MLFPFKSKAITCVISANSSSLKALRVAVWVYTLPNTVVSPITSTSGELKAAKIAIASSAAFRRFLLEVGSSRYWISQASQMPQTFLIRGSQHISHAHGRKSRFMVGHRHCCCVLCLTNARICVDQKLLSLLRHLKEEGSFPCEIGVCSTHSKRRHIVQKDPLLSHKSRW